MITMIETPRSSCIKAMGFEDGKLQLEFKSGGTYLYENVTAEIFRDMLQAPSIGKFFHRSINGIFEFTRVK